VVTLESQIDPAIDEILDGSVVLCIMDQGGKVHDRSNQKQQFIAVELLHKDIVQTLL
jgi:hypothetical protein